MDAVRSWVESTPLGAFGWTDALDIIILTWIFYQILVFIRGTRAMQSLVGLAALGVTYLLADRVGLHTLHWVLDNLFVWVVLAVVILFQEDIRRALARTGGTLFSRRSAPEDAQILEEIVKASFALAKKRVGGLIVIEKDAPITSYTEGAHRLDAAVSSELIVGIFHPSSPIHDGALLISDSRVHSAAVFLPISLSNRVGRLMGTRHRAAIGLSEQTDAICLVISEERGTVSFVQHGELVPVVDMNDLRQQLREGLFALPQDIEASVAASEVADA